MENTHDMITEILSGEMFPVCIRYSPPSDEDLLILFHWSSSISIKSLVMLLIMCDELQMDLALHDTQHSNTSTYKTLCAGPVCCDEDTNTELFGRCRRDADKTTDSQSKH